MDGQVLHLCCNEFLTTDQQEEPTTIGAYMHRHDHRAHHFHSSMLAAGQAMRRDVKTYKSTSAVMDVSAAQPAVF